MRLRLAKLVVVIVIAAVVQVAITIAASLAAGHYPPAYVGNVYDELRLPYFGTARWIGADRYVRFERTAEVDLAKGAIIPHDWKVGIYNVRDSFDDCTVMLLQAGLPFRWLQCDVVEVGGRLDINGGIILEAVSSELRMDSGPINVIPCKIIIGGLFCNLLVYIVTVMLSYRAAVAWWRYRSSRRRRARICEYCGYSCGMSASCSECGQVVGPRE